MCLCKYRCRLLFLFAMFLIGTMSLVMLFFQQHMSCFLRSLSCRRQFVLWLRLCCIAVLGSTTPLLAQLSPFPFGGSGRMSLLSEEARFQSLVQSAEGVSRTLALPFRSSYSDQPVLIRIESLVSAGERDLAGQVLDSVLAERTNSPLIPLLLHVKARLAHTAKNYTDAHRWYREVLRSAQANFDSRGDSLYITLLAEAYFFDGIVLLQQRGTVDAALAFATCAESFPDNPLADDALTMLARIAEVNGDYDKATDFYAMILRRYPRRNTIVNALLRKAQNAILQRRAQEALADLAHADGVIRSILDQSASSESPSEDSTTAPLYEPQEYCGDIREQRDFVRAEALTAIGKFPMAITAYQTFLQTYPSSELRVSALAGLGFCYLSTQQFAPAEQAFQTVIDAYQGEQPREADRTLAEAQLYHAIALKRLDNRTSARKELSGISVRSDYPLVPEALLELAQMQYEDGKTDDARKLLERSAREASNPATTARILFLLATVQSETGNYTGAETTLDRVIAGAEKATQRDFPDKMGLLAEAKLKRAIAQVQNKEYREAIIQLLQSVNDPLIEKSEALFWLGEAYYRADIIKNAEQTFRQYIKEFSDGTGLTATALNRTEEALYGIGWIEFRTRRFAESALTFTRLLREFPQSDYALDALARKGDGLYLIKQYRTSADAYRQAARLRGVSKEQQELQEYCAYQLGQALYRAGDYPMAIQEFQAFAGAKPFSSLADDALYTAAWIQFQQKNYELAINKLTDVAQRYPKSNVLAQVYYTLGDAYYNAEQFELAINAYRTVADTYPTQAIAASAVNAMQDCLVILGKQSEATALADRYINLNPQSDMARDVQFKKANIFYTGRNYVNAIAEFEDFLKKSADADKTVDALLNLARSYVAVGDTARSMKMYQDVYVRFPQSPLAEISLMESATLMSESGRITTADSLFALVPIRFPRGVSLARALFERAYLREVRKDTMTAMHLYDSVATRFAGTEFGDRSRFRRGMYYRANALHDSARIEFGKLLTRTDDLAAESQYRIAESWLRQKKYKQAIEAFLVSKTKYGQFEDWNSLAILNLGECYEQVRDIASAREMYRIVQSLRATDEFGQTAEARLKRLAGRK
jgi:TolA-binding protein